MGTKRVVALYFLKASSGERRLPYADRLLAKVSIA